MAHERWPLKMVDENQRSEKTTIAFWGAAVAQDPISEAPAQVLHKVLQSHHAPAFNNH